MVLGVVAVAAVLIVSFAVLLGPGSPGGGGGTTAVSSSTALGSAQQSLPSGGPWNLIEADGYNFWNATSIPYDINGTLTIPNCTLALPSAPPRSIEFPAYRGNLSDGNASVWLMLFGNPETGSVAESLVVGGAATWLVTISGGPNCLFHQLAVNATQAAPTVDSPAAAHAIYESGAAGYLAQYPSGISLTMLYYASAGASSWLFEYTPCGGGPGQETTGPEFGTGFSAVVDGSTGVVTVASEVGVDCEGNVTTVPIGTVLSLGPVSESQGAGTTGTIASQGCASGDYCYVVAIAGVSGAVTPQDLQLSVDDSSGATSAAPQGYAILGPGGAVLVYSTGPQETLWSDGTGSPTSSLTALDTVMVDMGTSDPVGLGYFLLVHGAGPYGDSTESISLP
jgi:hypothetical protein